MGFAIALIAVFFSPFMGIFPELKLSTIRSGLVNIEDCSDRYQAFVNQIDPLSSGSMTPVADQVQELEIIYSDCPLVTYREQKGRNSTYTSIRFDFPLDKKFVLAAAAAVEKSENPELIYNFRHAVFGMALVMRDYYASLVSLRPTIERMIATMRNMDNTDGIGTIFGNYTTGWVPILANPLGTGFELEDDNGYGFQDGYFSAYEVGWMPLNGLRMWLGYHMNWAHKDRFALAQARMLNVLAENLVCDERFVSADPNAEICFE